MKEGRWSFSEDCWKVLVLAVGALLGMAGVSAYQQAVLNAMAVELKLMVEICLSQLQ